MRKIIDYLIIAASFGTITLTSNVLAIDNSLRNQQLNENYGSKNGITQIRAGKFQGKFLSEQLNLDASQQEQIESIRAKYQPQMDSLRKNMRSERQKLATMIKNNEPQAKLRSQHQNITELKQQIGNVSFDAMLQMMELLTPEQKEQWAELMTNNRWRSRQRGQNIVPEEKLEQEQIK